MNPLIPTVALAPYDQRARAYAERAQAAATRRAYARDWAGFQTWLDKQPAAADGDVTALVLAYLMDEAERVKIATLRRKLVAIRAGLRSLGREMDLHRSGFREIWQGMRRTHAAAPVQKAPLIVAELRHALAALPATLLGTRDRALLLIGFAAGLRRSELASLRLDEGGAQIADTAEGLLIRLSASKTDQEGRGHVIAVPPGVQGDTCPVRAWRAWTQAAGITHGAAFRAVNRHGRIGPDVLSDRAIALIVKRTVASGARARGLDKAAAAELAARYSGHSLRAGLATSAAANDAPGHLIQRHLRHAKFDTTLGYIRAGERFKDNAFRFTGL